MIPARALRDAARRATDGQVAFLLAVGVVAYLATRDEARVFDYLRGDFVALPGTDPAISERGLPERAASGY